MTKTAYHPITPTEHFNLDHKYFAMYQEQGTLVPFIADSSDSISDIANICEDMIHRDRKAGKKRKHYFTPAASVEEIIAFPK